MRTKRTPAEIASLLREAEQALAEGKTLRQVAASMGVSESTLRRWRKTIGREGRSSGANPHSTHSTGTMEERYTHIFEAAIDAFWIVDTQGYVKEVNAATVELLGYSRDELMRLHISDIDVHDTFEDVVGHLDAVRSTGSARFEKCLRRKDGRMIDVEVGCSYVEHPDSCYVVFIRDVTERSRAERALRMSEERFRVLVDALPQFVSYVDRDLVYRFANHTYLDVFGLSPEMVIGRRLPDVIGPKAFEKARPHIEKVLAGERVRYHERYEYATGGVRDIDGVLTPDVDDNGHVRGYFAVLTDITVYMETLEALREESMQRDAAVCAGNIGLWDWDLQTNEVIYSTEWKRQIGYDDYEVSRSFEEWRSRVHPDDLQPTLDRIRRFLDEGATSYKVEFRFRHRDGHYLWILAQTSVIRDSGGQAVRALGSHVDITERKRIEEALARSEREKSLILDSTAELFAYYDLDLRIQWANRAAGDSVGMQPKELIGRHCYELWHHRDAPCEGCPVLRARDTGRTQEAEITTPDGRQWLLRGSPVFGSDGEVTALIEFGQDITERKRAEESVRESEARFRDLLEKLEHIPVQGYDANRVVVYWNEASTAVYGYTRDEAIGRRLEDLIIPDAAREAVVNAVDAWLAGGPAVPTGEIVLRDREGQPVPVYSSHIMHTTPRGEKELFCVDIDLRRLRRTEEELQRLSMAIEQAADAIVITDAEATIQYVNPAFERITGYSRDEAIGENPRILKSDEHDKSFYRALWQTLTSGQPWEGRFINRRKDGTLYTEEASISPVRDGNGEITNYVAAKRDISDQIRLEEQLRQSQKMDAVGQLAGGIAHDFNNILTAILGNAEFLGMELERLDAVPESILDALQQIESGGNRAAGLTRQLLAFSRRQTSQPRLLDVNSVLDDLEKMLRRLLTENITLDIQPAAGLWAMHADPSQVEQVIMNLVVNGRDAMRNGGTLTITTRNLTIDQPRYIAHDTIQPGRYVLLEVRDTGCGIERETIPRIFEPFFTTKEMGRGTGLGLATVYGVVKQTNGYIGVESELGRGSVFTVYWPAEEGITTPVSDRRVDYAALSGTEAILLCEDDDAVRDLAARVLRSAGYEVLVASNGREALDAIDRHNGPIHLIVTDVIMTDMNGRELARRLTERLGDVPTMYISGYTADLIAEHGVLDEGVQFLEKPFTREVLLGRVRSVLGAN